jgi:hypothetical protein
MNPQNIQIPVLVYQMGKVASKTIEASLNRINIPSVSMHVLSDEALDELESSSTTSPSAMKSYQISKSVRTLIEFARGKRAVKVVTLVREPVSRTVSNIFQNMQSFYPQLYGRTDPGVVPEITEKLLQRFHSFNERTHYICTWFDKEIKKVFNFDIYAMDFDRTPGYQIYNTPDADILLIKLERLYDCYKVAFRQFLGISDFQLLNTNISCQKAYYPVYKNVKETIKVPMSDLDNIYNTRFARQFYTDQEIAGFKRKWAGKVVCQRTMQEFMKKYNGTGIPASAFGPSSQ